MNKLGLRTATFLVAGWAALGVGVATAAEAKPKTVKLDGYAEWRQGDVLVVDGQRVHPYPHGSSPSTTTPPSESVRI